MLGSSKGLEWPRFSACEYLPRIPRSSFRTLMALKLCISMLWSVFDLVSDRVFKHGMPLRLIAWIDLLGFVAFLVFLIVNGIIGSNEWNSDVSMLLAYTSVPWIVIHGLIVAQYVLPYPFGNLHLNETVCPDCHRDWKAHGGSTTRDGETYALLHDEDDIEAHVGTAVKVNDGDATARAQRQQPDL
ncbi:MAG: hypothetical protein L6R39_001645 [Caloplaca ligustica]|nr:MAG: hypothetical protein L6R39_001645 [Caloplaca ligustica]